MAFEWILRCIWACCIIGILANCLVVYIVQTTHARMGYFKYFLIFFALIEITFSFIVFFAQPFFYAYDYRLIIYSHSDIPFLSRTILGKVAIGLYCSFYELWMGVVVMLFVYKYIVLCRRSFADKVKGYWYWKGLLLFIYFVHLVYSMICGIWWCNNTVIPESTHTHVQEVLKRYADKNYLVLTFKAYDGSFSLSGLMSAFDHLAYATLTGIITSYCGWNIWQTILEMHRQRAGDIRQQVQVFNTLVLQALIPFVLYQLPTSFFVLDALLEKDPILTNYIPIWPLCISLPKAIDPFIILLLIKDYRMATRNLFKRMFKSLCGRRPNMNFLAGMMLANRSSSVATETLHLDSRRR